MAGLLYLCLAHYTNPYVNASAPRSPYQCLDPYPNAQLAVPIHRLMF